MNTKNVIIAIVIAIVFAVGGYFAGKGISANQEASIFSVATNQNQLLQSTGNVIARNVFWVTFDDGDTWCIRENASGSWTHMPDSACQAVIGKNGGQAKVTLQSIDGSLMSSIVVPWPGSGADCFRAGGYLYEHNENGGFCHFPDPTRAGVSGVQPRNSSTLQSIKASIK